MHYQSFLAAIALIFAAASCNPSGQPATSAFGKAEEHYKTYCASCHGEKMLAFTDRQWTHGNTDSALLASINHGYPDAGMPGFDSVLTEKDKSDLVAYIQSGIANAGKYTFDEKPTSNLFSTDSMQFRLDTVFSGNGNIPWSIAFLPGGDLLVTERGGQLFRVAQDRTTTEINGVPAVLAEGQGGLFDVTPDPGFAGNKTIYLSYAKGLKTDSGMVATTAVSRAVLDGNELKQVTEIFEATPYWKTKHHYGGRLAFTKEGYLLITVGDRGKEFVTPQSLLQGAGKIHRIKTDGSVPADNPFVQQPGAVASVYSYGHRNPQGMAIHPQTGAIWENEHGPRGGDEINIAESGKNYGWPVISHGINYDGKIIAQSSAREGMEQPLLYWLPSIGPSGMAFLSGDRYKGWSNVALVGSLRFRYLNVCHLSQNRVVREETVLKNIGRVRDVRVSPDGWVYVAVESPGYVFKLIPVQ
jgi:glucose/arabinose dehydrogenase